MKRTSLLISLIVLLCHLEGNATRSLYVDGFASILGNTTAEENLLSYAQTNGIETLLLYELHIVNASYNLSDPTTNSILAAFISKAKTSYGIISVGAISENADSFTNYIDPYNNSRTASNEKFDIYNLEFEFWVSSATDPGGYYCNTYLDPNSLPCTNDGAFDFFISTLQTMKNLATNNTHPIKVEAYVGWPTADQANEIGKNLDRLRIHAYVSDPNSAFGYADDRLIDYANSNPGVDVSIIFSSETGFMKNWLITNSMSAAETIFAQDWTIGSSGWSNNINLEGFTYFTYTENTDITLSTNSYTISEPAKIYPIPVRNILSIENYIPVNTILIYDNVGRLIIETKKDKIDVSNLANGVYSLQIHTDKYIETKLIIKE